MAEDVTVYFTREQRDRAADIFGISDDGRGGYKFDSATWSVDHRLAELRVDPMVYHIPAQNILMIRGIEETS